MVGPNQPLVSVVIPCLNRAHFLIPTIESILRQDYPNIECIVVDGGSTDGTTDILNRYGDRTNWVSEPDRGQADAINKGWKMSRGEILAWLNADDVWVVPNAVSQVVAYLAAHPEVDIVYGETTLIDANGKEVAGSTHRREWNLEFAVEHCQHIIGQPAAFIRRSIVEKVGWLDTSFRQKMDHEFWLRVGLQGEIRHIPVLLASVRDLPDDTSHQWQTAITCVRLTHKFFNLANVPQALKIKRKRAMSNSYLRGMDFAFRGGRFWPIIFSYALRAAMTDPSNAYNAFRKLRLYVFISLIENRHLQWFWRIARRIRAHFGELSLK